MKSYLLFFMLLTTSLNVFAVCEIPSDLEKPIPNAQRMNCLKDSYFLKPSLQNMDVATAAAGPKLSEVTFRSNETVFCRYFYRYQNGESNKFRCYRTDQLNQLMNTKGEVIPNATEVGAPNAANEDFLLDKAGNPILNSKQKPMKADVLKVRFQDGSNRQRENYASTVATRLSWIMGFPTEHYFSVAKVTCFGCEKDPWKNGRDPQKNYNPQLVNDFPYASIERKNEAKRVIKAFTSKDNKITITPWTWDDFVSRFGTLSSLQKHEIQVMALYANFFQTVENTGQQHVLLCEAEFYDKANNTCSKTLAATHDMGAAFGNRDRKWIDPATKNHPRADFLAFQDAKVFRPNTCDLVTIPGGLTKVDEPARIDFVQRLELLTPEIIKAVLAEAYFQYADLPFRKKIEQAEGLEGKALDERILDLWTQLIINKINELKNSRCQNSLPVDLQ